MFAYTILFVILCLFVKFAKSKIELVSNLEDVNVKENEEFDITIPINSFNSTGLSTLTLKVNQDLPDWLEVKQSLPLFAGRVFEPLGISGYTGGQAQVRVAGIYAYVVMSQTVRVLNITDRSNPIYVTSILPAEVTNEYIQDIVLSSCGSYLYMLQTSPDPKYLKFYNVSDKNNITLFYENYASSDCNTPANLFLTDKFLYCICRSKLNIFNVTDPTSPSQVLTDWEYDTVDFVYNLFVEGIYLYYGAVKSGITSYFRIFNIANKNSPVHTDSYIVTGGAYGGMTVLNDIAYLASDALTLLDVQDRGDIKYFTEHDIIGLADSLIVRGDGIAVVSYEKEMKVFNVSSTTEPPVLLSTNNFDPTNPYTIGVGDSDGLVFDPTDWNIVYGTSSSYGVLTILDITDLGDPTLISTYYLNPRTFDVSVQGNYAYLTADYNGVRIFDISDISHPTFVGREYQGMGLPVRSLEAHGELFFLISGTNSEIRAYNLTNPGNPTLSFLDTITTYSSTSYYIIDGTNLFLNYYGGVQIVNFTDPSDIQFRSRIDVDGCNRVKVTRAGTDIFYTSGRSGAVGCHYMAIFDFSDFSNPKYVGKFEDYKIPCIQVVGDYAYACDYDSSDIILLNITNASEPKYMYHLGYDGYIGSTMDIRIDETETLLFFSGSGLKPEVACLDISNRTHPTLLGKVMNTVHPEQLRIFGNYLYLVGNSGGNSYRGGLDVFRFGDLIIRSSQVEFSGFTKIELFNESATAKGIIDIVVTAIKKGDNPFEFNTNFSINVVAEWKCNGWLFNDSRACSNHGSCVQPNICSCDNGYYDEKISFCSDYDCHGLKHDSDNVCNFLNGSCDSYNNCTCNDGYFGKECERWKCDDILYNYTTVCNGHGVCLRPNLCFCDGSYYPGGGEGKYCNMFDCFGFSWNESSVCNYRNGTCSSPNNCTSCNSGYFSIDCSLWNCYEKLFNDSEVCNEHGDCLRPQECSCYEGYSGVDCSLYDCNGTAFNNSEVCNGKGNCTSPGICVCEDHYYDSDEFCKWYDCYGKRWDGPEVCNLDNGTCDSYNNCTCVDGYFGVDCTLWNCYEILFNSSSSCSTHGVCIGPDKCVGCDDGYFGVDCGLYKCNETLFIETGEVCNGKGNCTKPDNCSCQTGYSDQYCDFFTCFDVGYNKNNGTGKVCSGHGKCNSYDNCSCDEFYGNSKCDSWSCFGVPFDLNHSCAANGSEVSYGFCVGHDTCLCFAGYLSLFPNGLCTEWYCGDYHKDDPKVCSGRGVCKNSHNCVCSGGFEGSNCDHDPNSGDGSDGVGAIIGGVIGGVFFGGGGVCSCCFGVMRLKKGKSDDDMIEEDTQMIEMEESEEVRRLAREEESIRKEKEEEEEKRRKDQENEKKIKKKMKLEEKKKRREEERLEKMKKKEEEKKRKDEEQRLKEEEEKRKEEELKIIEKRKKDEERKRKEEEKKIIEEEERKKQEKEEEERKRKEKLRKEEKEIEKKRKEEKRRKKIEERKERKAKEKLRKEEEQKQKEEEKLKKEAEKKRKEEEKRIQKEKKRKMKEDLKLRRNEEKRAFL